MASATSSPFALAKLVRSLKYYALVNGLNVVLACASFHIVRVGGGLVGTLVALYAAVLLRILAMIAWFEMVGRYKQQIHGEKRHALTSAQRRAIYLRILWLAVPTDCVMFVYAQPRLWAQVLGAGNSVNDGDSRSPWMLVRQFVAFIPKSLVFEIAFDLFHYVAHWTCHRVPMIYQHVHKRHHLHLHPCALSTYEQDAVDLVLTNIMPFVLASRLSPPFSAFQSHLLFAYKTHVEVAGHCGLELKGLSFPQLPLVNVFGICMRVHDHDLHHTHPKFNFAKRFTLWDKIFGTFQHATTAQTAAKRPMTATNEKETSATALPPHYY